MRFFSKKDDLATKKQLPPDEKGRISFLSKWLKFFTAMVSGVLLAMAFPPLNWSSFAFVAMVPLMLIAMSYTSKKQLFFLGYIQGFFWAIFAFWWLREIDYAIPFFLAAILGVWFGVFLLIFRVFFKGIVWTNEIRLMSFTEREKAPISWWRELIFAFAAAAIFPCLEYFRIKLFPWNFIGVSQYKSIELIQVVEYTGIYGVTYLIFLVNSALAVNIYRVRNNIRNGRRCNLYSSLAAAVILFGVILLGAYRIAVKNREQRQLQEIKFGVVQGNISQRRVSDDQMAEEALNVYLALSEQLLNKHPEVDIVIWPETAVPYPYYGAHDISRKYRYLLSDLISKSHKKFLIGSLDFYLNRGEKRYELTNAALLFDSYGKNIGKYEKINRVPFGEFIPMRKFLPQWLIRIIDMNRDLRAGTCYEPLELMENVRAGMAICYESIFASLARRERQLGANILLAINNDAWYPRSSEPEQHLANAVFRAIENGVSALRVGNNGGTVLINRNGVIEQSLLSSPIDRGSGCGVISCQVPIESSEMTFYTRFGDVFLGILALIMVISLSFCIYKELKFKKIRSFNE